jgi:hypothetical protein
MHPVKEIKAPSPLCRGRTCASGRLLRMVSTSFLLPPPPLPLNFFRLSSPTNHRPTPPAPQINDRWRRYIGYQGDDMVEDRSLHDYWMANLQDLYTRMRVFSYDDPWPLPLRVPSEQHVSQDEVSAFAVVAHEEWMRADALAAAAEEEVQEAAAAASGSVDSPGTGASYSPQY